MPFPSAPMNYVPPTASQVGGMAPMGGGGMNPMQMMLMQNAMGGMGGQQGQQQSGGQQPQKAPYSPVSTDFLNNKYGDLIKEALMSSRMGMGG